MKTNTWTKEKLDALISIKHGYAFSSTFFSTKETDKILLTPGNFHVNGNLYFGSNTKYYEGEVNSEYILSNGDLLIVMTDLTKEMNILGNTIFLQSNKTVLHNQRIGKILIKKEDLLIKEFLRLILNSEICKSIIRQKATGTTVRHTSNQTLLSIQIPLPPLNEQKKIAEILGTCDRTLELTEKLITAKRKLKQALIQKLLTGKLRFPEFEREKWHEVQISDVASLVKKKFNPHKTKEDRDCIELEHLESQTGRLIGSTKTSNLSSQKSCFQKQDILFGKLRPYLEKFFFADFEGVCSTEIWVLRANTKRCLPEYLFRLVQSKNFLDFANKSSGTKMPRANWKTVSECPIFLPSIAEQNKICLIFQYLDKQIDKLLLSIYLYQSQKKGLMQQLLTGKIRVKIDN